MSEVIYQQFLDISSEISNKLSDGISRVGPIQLKRRPKTPFAEVLCRSVAGQQLSTRAANTIWNRVVDAAEDTPLLKFIHVVDIQTLRACGLSNAKATSMKGIATIDQSGELNSKELGRLTHQERSNELVKLKGIGQWTADMMSIFYFREPDVWPDGDLAVRRTLEQLTSRRRKTVRTAEKFAPYRTYLALYLWKIANTGL